MKNNIPTFLLERPSSGSPERGKGRLKIPFLEKGMYQLADVIRTGYVQWETASRDNFFQRIDARIKVLFLLFFVVIVSLKRGIGSELLIALFVFVLVVLSRLSIFDFYKRVILLAFFFGFLIALPSAFNVITNGEIVVPVVHLSRPYGFWIYRIPQEIGITREGAYGVMMLTARVMNSLALSFLVFHTTPFPQIIKALKVLKVPDSLLMIITLSYKYMFLFAKTAEDMHLAKKSRLAGQVNGAEARRWIAGRLALLLKKTRTRCEEVFKAMLGRGFSDDIKISSVAKLRTGDWVAGAALFLAGVFFLWM
ncbi:MAG TPA: cobalt ECF transporter T component CbiQ [Thermodesulfovibrionales bacterium]|nr:cobalt ECF transporter T component CbiQ [Thermodesulfovibrionales bacterium]